MSRAGSGILRRLADLGKESAVYGIGAVVSRSMAIFLVPLYTRVFSPADYGVIALITTIVSFAVPFTGLGAEASVAMHYYDSDQPEHRATVLLNYLLIQLVGGAVVVLLMVPAAPLLATSLLGGAANASLLLLALGAMLLSGVNAVVNNAFRLMRRPWVIVAYDVAFTLINVTMTVTLVVVLRRGLVGNYAAQLSAAGLLAIAGLWLLRHVIRTGRVSWHWIRRLVVLGLPYIPTTLALMAITLFGRVLLEHHRSLEEVGLFAVATSLCGLIGLGTTAFQLALGPYAFSIQHEPEARSIYTAILKALLTAGMAIAVVVSVFAEEILRIFTTETYTAAAPVVPFLAMNVVVVSVGYVASLGCWIAKRTGSLAWTTAIGAATSILLSLLMIPRFGIIGAGAAVLAGQCVYVAFLFYASHRVYPIPYRWRDTFLVPAVSALVIAIGMQLRAPSMGTTLLLKSLVLLLYPVGLLLTGVLTPSYVRRVSDLVRRRRSTAVPDTVA